MRALCSDTIIIALMIALEKRFVIGGQNPSDPLFSHPLKSSVSSRVSNLWKKKKKCKLQSVIITGNDEFGSFEGVFDRANDSVASI